MQTALRIDYHGMEPSEGIESRIAEHISALEQLFGGMTACRVGLRAPGTRHRNGGVFEVSIRMTLRGGADVEVQRKSRLDGRHADPLFAMDDAFRRARRQLLDQVRRRQDRVKAHEAAEW